MKTLDLSGKVFGKLTAKHVVGTGDKRVWLCSCECGGEVEVITFQLTSGGRKQCDSVWHKTTFNKDQVIGKLTIREYIPSKDFDGNRAGFLCECSCGNYEKIAAKTLQRGRVSCESCKVVVRKNLKPLVDTMINKTFYNYKSNAKRKGLLMELTKSEYSEIVQQPCHYCAGFDTKTRKTNKGEDSCKMNGVDRKDSSIGYFKGNCIPCCKSCNYLKNDTPYEDFVKMIEIIYNTLKNKK